MGPEGRAEVLGRLASGPFLPPPHPSFMHGRGYAGPMTLPEKTWASDQKPRDDHDAPEWLTALDVPDVLNAKVANLAQLLRLSKKTVVYSGAGISRCWHRTGGQGWSRERREEH